MLCLFCIILCLCCDSARRFVKVTPWYPKQVHEIPLPKLPDPTSPFEDAASKEVMLQVDADSVVIDNSWLWRADHVESGQLVQWQNPCQVQRSNMQRHETHCHVEFLLCWCNLTDKHNECDRELTE